MIRRLFVVVLVLSSVCAFSQDGPRTWRDHTSLNYCNSVTRLGTTIYASNVVGVVRFDQMEEATESVTKINGLSDIGVRLLRTNPYNNKLLVVYENCNIDIIDLEGNIRNYADFKLKAFNGKKIINEVTFQKEMAYLACGFGIVQFDTDKREIRETFFIGPNGTDMEVYQVALNDSLIFAATASGLYRSNYKLKNLKDFNSWKLDTVDIPPGPYVGVVCANDTVFTAYSPYKTDASKTLRDTIYKYTSSGWSKYNPGETGYTVRKFCMTSGSYISYLNQTQYGLGMIVRHVTTAKPLNYITSFNGEYFEPNDLFFGVNAVKNTVYWVSDNVNGLYHTLDSYPYYRQYPVTTEGMNLPQVNSIDMYKGKMVISPSHPDEAGGTTYSRQGINVMSKGEWTYVLQRDPASNLPFQDITYAFTDRKDTSHMWASSWRSGLLEYKNNAVVRIYNASNSGIGQINPDNPRIAGLGMDSDGNLWFANSDVANYLGVVKKDGNLVSFNFGTPRFTRKILVDRNNYVWAIHEREQGITVFKNDNFKQPILGVNFKVLTKDVGNGNIQSNAVHSIAEDKEGKIWVGTAAGVAVFYNPSSVFNSSGFDAQPIKIVQDGNVELLLAKEVVKCIAVDGANNKWIGTASGGVYCFSSDGLTQLYHFTESNSPLYSNSILDIGYDETTGDVYFGTERGLQSFRGTIVAGSSNYDNIYAYPNPVKPNYAGTVLVKGLLDNSSVKIVDEGGNLAWETKSKGGQIEWPVTNFSGNRVAPGVYVVYASTTDGASKAVTKILVIN